MAQQVSAFPLRLRDPRLRELVREVASAEGVSQNEVIEHAVLEEMIVKGRLLAVDLQLAADRISRLTDTAYRALVERSLTDFAEGEAHPDPIATRAWHQTKAAAGVPASVSSDELGVLAAFQSSYR